MGIALPEGTPIDLRVAEEEGLARGGTAAPVQSIAVTYVPQERDHWCWAACFQMIGEALGIGAMSQLEMARRVFGAGACANPSSSSCDKAAFPDEVAHYFGLTCTLVENPLNHGDVVNFLAYGPVEVGFEADTNAGAMSHVALIVGTNGDGTVDFLDPWPDFGPSSPTVAQLQSHYHWGAWMRSYVEFAPA